MRVVKDLIQGSPEWLLFRKGRPSASRFSEIITPTGKPSKSAKGYARELIAEAFAPDYEQWAGNRYTAAGQALEPEARELFSKTTGLQLEQVGFCLSDDNVSGCSPDSLIIKDGVYVAGLEVKCGSPSTHIEWVADGVIPPEHSAQCHGGLVITGLPEWHFWSYFPGLKPFHVVVTPNEFTEQLRVAVAQFVGYYKSEYDRLKPLLQIS